MYMGVGFRGNFDIVKPKTPGAANFTREFTF